MTQATGAMIRRSLRRWNFHADVEGGFLSTAIASSHVFFTFGSFHKAMEKRVTPFVDRGGIDEGLVPGGRLRVERDAARPAGGRRREARNVVLRRPIRIARISIRADDDFLVAVELLARHRTQRTPDLFGRWQVLHHGGRRLRAGADDVARWSVGEAGVDGTWAILAPGSRSVDASIAATQAARRAFAATPPSAHGLVAQVLRVLRLRQVAPAFCNRGGLRVIRCVSDERVVVAARRLYRPLRGAGADAAVNGAGSRCRRPKPTGHRTRKPDAPSTATEVA